MARYGLTMNPGVDLNKELKRENAAAIKRYKESLASKRTTTIEDVLRAEKRAHEIALFMEQVLDYQ